jgi:hypothetical protein
MQRNLFTSVRPSKGDSRHFTSFSKITSFCISGGQEGEVTVSMSELALVMADDPRDRNWLALRAMDVRMT